MAVAKPPTKPPTTKPARAKRAPSGLSVAVRAVNALKRANAQRDKLFTRINDLDTKIVSLQEIAQSQMDAVQRIIEGKPADDGAPAGGA